MIEGRGDGKNGNGKRIVVTIKALVNDTGMILKCAHVREKSIDSDCYI